jgi:hypothetical protein
MSRDARNTGSQVVVDRGDLSNRVDGRGEGSGTTQIGTAIEPDNLRRVWYPLRDAAGLGRCASTICGTRV